VSFDDDDDGDFGGAEDSTAVISKADIASLYPSALDRHVLVRLDGSDVGQVINLPKSTYTIGRNPTSNLHLNFEGVSRRHAQILFKGEHYVLEDLGSSNGTTVGGERITTHYLRDGDIIRFGPRISVRYSVTDVKEEKMLRHLYEASVRDSLTGAFNREYLNERLRTELAFARRHETNTALILFDLDHFKRVNDTYGHQAGDEVLIQVSKSALISVRTEDVFARYGGEEFAISLRGEALPAAAALAERLRQLNDCKIKHGDDMIPITISAGCAAMTCCEEPTVEGLIAIADRRLYAAKDAGRNRVVSSG
jgi:two-component system cell cycle response regulator